MRVSDGRAALVRRCRRAQGYGGIEVGMVAGLVTGLTRTAGTTSR